MKKISIGALIIALLIPLLVGGLSAAISAHSMVTYGNMNKPPLSPPAWVFSVAWTFLYILMGLASYYIFISDADSHVKAMALIFYGIQLAANFMWSIIFFNWESYLSAFIWLVLLWCIVVMTAFRFYGVNKIAAYLLVPYILWLTFAGYLNMGAYMLSLESK